MIQISVKKWGRVLTHTLLVATILTMVAACGSSRTADKPAVNNASEYAYASQVVDNNMTAQAITAKTKVELNANGRNISLSGTLRMYRDDVIQLSVSFLGMEVGRMEFTEHEVLVVDRVHKEYVRVPYSRVSFLSKAQLDFNTLQSLFWNEVFIPGSRDVTAAINRFRLSESGAYIQFNLTDTPQLEYAFLTNKNLKKLERTTIKSKNISDPTQVVWRYGAFSDVAGRKFPSTMEMKVTGTPKEYSLGLTFSRIDTSTDWQRRTEVSSKYTEKNIDDILSKLTSLS